MGIFPTMACLLISSLLPLLLLLLLILTLLMLLLLLPPPPLLLLLFQVYNNGRFEEVFFTNEEVNYWMEVEHKTPRRIMAM